MRRPLVAGLVVLAASTCLLSVTPAQAAERTFVDRTGDVGHRMDVRRVHVANNHRLVVTVKHRAVTQRSGAWSGLYIDVTPRRRASPDYYLAGSVGGGYQLYWMDGWRIGGTLGCPGGTYRYGYSTMADTTRFSLARSCLDGASTRATRVRVAVTAGVRDRPIDWAPAHHRYSRWVPLG